MNNENITCSKCLHLRNRIEQRGTNTIALIRGRIETYCSIKEIDIKNNSNPCSRWFENTDNLKNNYQIVYN